MPKLLLIAYYFPPHRLVGSFRAAGFHRYLPEHGWETHVLTATAAADPAASDPSVTRLPEVPPSRLPGLKDPSAAWADHHRAAIASLIERVKPDAVLMTGGPFLYFKLGPWIRRRFGLPVVLDYRDPFLNPRHPARALRDAVARFLESRWNARAAAILIPTERMRELVRAPRSVPVHVVENGFDDAALEGLPAASPARASQRTFVYTGKLYEKASPIPLLRALKEVSESGAASRLLHLGEPSEDAQAQARDEDLPLVALGQRSYAESLQAIRDAEVAVILSEGHRFEATTKVYDYIALGKPILGVGVSEGSGIHEILERYGRYRLCPNQPEALVRAVRDMEPIGREPLGNALPLTFGRRFQAKRLAEILEQVIR